MPITEKGYKPYEGKRLPSKRNHWIIAKMEARRIWASALVKVVVILSLLPPVGYMIYCVAMLKFVLPLNLAAAGAQGMPVDEGEALAETFSPELVLDAMGTQMIFVVLMTLAWGAGTIASEARGPVRQFDFAKPVTSRTYLLGKIIPLAVYCWVITIVPAVLLVAFEAVALRSQDLWASRLALILPAMLHAVVLSVVLSTCSVAASSLSRSRLLTLSFWAGALFVPMAVAWIVELSTRGEAHWAYLASILNMIRTLGEAIFRLEVEGPIQWFHALAVLAALSVGAAFLMRHRLTRPEVVG